jgi:S1-C subfamily serine protease
MPAICRLKTHWLCIGVLWVASVLPALAAAEDAPRGWLGVQFQTETIQIEPGDPRTGFRVLGVIEDGPAARAGLRARDFIVSINGSLPNDGDALVNAIQTAGPGDSIEVVLRRGSDTLTRKIGLAERPRNPREATIRIGWIGLEAIDLPAELQEHFGAPEDHGAMISHLEPGSPAEAAGFELGDVVYSVDEFPVRGARELLLRVGRAGVGNRVEIELMRGGVKIVLEATVEKEPAEPILLNLPEEEEFAG